MGISYIDDKYLTQIANSIRTKVGGNTMISPPEMPDAILSISGEGSSSSAFWTVNITPTSHQTIQATITPAAKSGTSSFTLSSLDVPTVTTKITPSSGYMAGTVSVSRSGTVFTVSATPATVRPAGNGSITIYFDDDSNTYDVNDTVIVNARIYNDSSETITGITVNSGMDKSWYVSSLAPGEFYTLNNFEYTVTEDDIVAGEIVIDAIASFNSEEVSETKTYTTAELNGNMEITIDEDSGSYQENSTVPISWTVTNTGNVTLHNIIVSCTESGDEVTIEYLYPGDTYSDVWSYTATNAWINNDGEITITASGSLPNSENADVEVEETTNYNVIKQYTLTINYVDENENSIYPSYIHTDNAGTSYSVSNPSITGYITTLDRVSGTLTENTTFNVEYTKRTCVRFIQFIYQNGSAVVVSYSLSITDPDTNQTTTTTGSASSVRVEVPYGGSYVLSWTNPSGYTSSYGTQTRENNMHSDYNSFSVIFVSAGGGGGVTIPDDDTPL